MHRFLRTFLLSLILVFFISFSCYALFPFFNIIRIVFYFSTFESQVIVPGRCFRSLFNPLIIFLSVINCLDFHLVLKYPEEFVSTKIKLIRIYKNEVKANLTEMHLTYFVCIACGKAELGPGGQL